LYEHIILICGYAQVSIFLLKNDIYTTIFDNFLSHIQIMFLFFFISIVLVFEPINFFIVEWPGVFMNWGCCHGVVAEWL